MSFRFVFQIPGDQAAQLDRTLLGVSGSPDEVLNPQNSKSAANRIAESFREITEEQIESEGTRGGTGYTPLSPSYAATKAEGLGVLVFSGDMREALTRPGGDNYVSYSNGALELGLRPGSEVHKRASFHQSGTSRMPSRPPVVLTEGDKRNWTREILKSIRSLMR